MSRHFVTSNAEAVELGLTGFCALNADLVRWHADPRFVLRASAAENKVALLSGGGSGHEPLHVGFVGVGMLDAAVPGEVFASPSAEQVRAASMAVDNGRGVLHVVKNYTGDVINFALAADRCRDAGVAVETVLVDDDVPGAARGGRPGRRGTVATVVVEKICGAAAEAGVGLSELAELGRRVVDSARSVGIAVAAGSHFGGQADAFALQDDEVEYGVGIHGERGTARVPDEGLPAMISALTSTLLDDLGASAAPHLMIINGLGSTTSLELHGAYRLATEELQRRGITITRAVVDDLVTSLDMRGLSLTLVRLDEELTRWWDAPARTPAWRTPPSAPAIAASPMSPSGSVVHDHAEQIDPTTAAQLRGWLDAFGESVRDQSSSLGDLDRRAGDGDFGDNLVGALDRYRRAAAEIGNPSGGDLCDRDPAQGAGDNPFHLMSDAFARVGGTSGPILALWIGTLGRHLGADLTAQALAAGLLEAAERVQELGGATPGDKTMVDAMVPAAEAAATGQGSVQEAVEAAAQAAREAAEETVDLVASRGRASYLGETSRGIGDPGAIAIALFLEAGAAHLGREA